MPLPLDRIITLLLEADGTFVDGVYNPGPITEHRVWARRVSAGSTDAVDSGSGLLRIRSVVEWTIRYREDVAQHAITRLYVRDEEGNTWNAEEISESDMRRRYITISAIRSSS